MTTFKRLYTSVFTLYSVSLFLLHPVAFAASAQVGGISFDQRLGKLETQLAKLHFGDAPSVTIVDTAGGNLLRNSSFEAGGNGSAPAQWNYQLDSTSGNTYLSQEGIHSGSEGLKFQGGGSGNFGISQPTTKTTPQRTYTFSAFVKAVNTPATTLRIGFWDERNNHEGMFKNISISGTRDWKRVYMTVKTPGLVTDPTNWYPVIQVQGLRSGNVYVDDAQLTEGGVLTTYNTALAGGSGTALSLGDGSILTSPAGDLYTSQSGVGNLGTSGSKWNSLNLTKASIDSNGNLNLSGGLTVGALGSGIVHVNGSGVASSAAIGLGSGDVSGTLPVGNGGTGVATTPTNGQLLIGNGSGFGLSTLTAGSGVTITNSSGAVTIAVSPGGTTAFSSITGGTNTAAAMVVGSGSSLAPSGTGTVNANQLNGQTTSVGGALTTASSFTTAGANALTLTTTAATNVTLPTTGTLSTLAGTETLTNKTVNGLTPTAAADGFTIAGGTVSRTLTVTGANITVGNTIQPTAAGALAVQSNGANGLTLDAGGAAAVNIGNTNANALAFGNGTSNPTYTFNGSGTFSTSTGATTLNGNTTLAANKSLTLSSGTGTIAQTYSNTTGTASTFAVTNSNAGAGTSVNGLAVNLAGTVPSSGTNTNTGITFGNVTAVGSNTFNAITFGTGYTNFITSPNINITAAGVISGAGSYNGVSLSSTTVQPVAAGPFTFQSNGANTVTLDAGGAAAVNIGNTNANAITLGANTTVSANKSLTLSSGTGQLSQTYSNTAAGNASAYSITNGNTAVTATTVNGLDLTLTNATNTNNSNTLNGITLEAASNNNSNVVNGINFASATGYTNFIKTPSLTITSAGNITGAGTIGSGAITVTNTGTNALAVGQAGITNPALNVDTSTVSSATGLNVKSAAAAGGLALSVLSSGTNENLTINAKGTGTVSINNTATGGITLGQATTVTTGGLTVSAGGVTVTGNSVLTGHLKSNQVTAPTIGTPTACGTTPTAAVTAGSTDSAGQFTITGGTGTPGNCAAVVTFNATYGGAPKAVILTPTTTTGGAKNAYVSAILAGSFTVTLATAPAASEANTWSYLVIE